MTVSGISLSSPRVYQCAAPGCETLIVRGEYCSRCYKQRRARSRGGIAYKSFKAAKKGHLQAHPVCQRCRARESSFVHIRVPLENDQALISWNLEALCWRCFKRTEKRRKGRRRGGRA